jgi:hypothetical protein
MAAPAIKASLRAFLDGLIDYAGLFPPAGLPLSEALATWRRHRAGREAFLLTRFVCPAARLDDLARELGAGEEASPLPLSMLAGGADDPAGFIAAVREAAGRATAFAAADGRVSIAGWELKLPPGDDGGETLAAAREALPDVPLFFEADAHDWARRWPALIDRVARLNRDHGAQAGFKLRCGGLEPADFPESERVAQTLHRARLCGAPLKFTAGLHHPVRHRSRQPVTMMHGFLNVFGAGILGHSYDLRDRDLLPILEERDGRQFRFDDWGFVWRELRAGVADIRQARRLVVTSFGSCSVDEPLEDLVRLRLLPAAKERP